MQNSNNTDCYINYKNNCLKIETHKNYSLKKNEKKTEKINIVDTDSGTFSSEEDNISKEIYYNLSSTVSSLDLIKKNNVNNFFFYLLFLYYYLESKKKFKEYR